MNNSADATRPTFTRMATNTPTSANAKLAYLEKNSVKNTEVLKRIENEAEALVEIKARLQRS